MLALLQSFPIGRRGQLQGAHMWRNGGPPLLERKTDNMDSNRNTAHITTLGLESFHLIKVTLFI